MDISGKILELIDKQNFSKKKVYEKLGITDDGFAKKLKKGYFTTQEVQLLSELFNVPITHFFETEKQELQGVSESIKYSLNFSIPISEKILQLAKEQKVTKRKIHELLGISAQGLDLKIKKNYFTTVEIEKLSTLFGVSGSFFLGGEKQELQEASESNTVRYIHSNIKYLRKKKGISQQDLANAIGKKDSIIGSYENGETEPSLETISKISSFFGVSEVDFIYKNLSELPKSTALQVLTSKDVISKQDALYALENEGLVGRKVYISPEPAMAASPSSYVSDDENELDWFYMPFLKKNGFYAAFSVVGQSMQGCVNMGSSVICRLLDDNRQIRGGNIHLIATVSEGLVLKRIEINPKKIRNGIICYSDNPVYYPFALRYEEIVRVWAVEACIDQNFTFTNEKATLKLEQYLENFEENY